jgi:hypothetical protein
VAQRVEGKTLVREPVAGLSLLQKRLTPLAYGGSLGRGGCYAAVIILTDLMSESGGMVDTLDLGSSAFGRAGSSPASRTPPGATARVAFTEKWSV